MTEGFNREILEEYGEEYIEPAKDEEVAQQEIIKTLLQDKENFSYVDFAKLVISYNLKHLNITDGIAFRTFSSNVDEKKGVLLGCFSPTDNSIMFNVANKSNPVSIMETLSHETMHKFQHDKNLTSKLLSGNEKDSYTFSHSSERFYSLCGFDKKFAYILDKSETEAFDYGFDTALKLTEQAMSHYENDDSENFDESKLPDFDRKIYSELHESYKKLGDRYVRHNLISEGSFSGLKKEIPQYIQNGLSLFDKYMKTARDAEEQITQLEEGQDLIAGIFAGKQLKSVSVLANIAAHIPQRTLISDLVNFATTCSNPQTYNMCLESLTEEGVPLTLSDFYKIFMQAESFTSGNMAMTSEQSVKEITDSVISKIDEKAVAKLLMVTHGVNDAKARIEETKFFNDTMDDEAGEIIFSIPMDADKVLEEISKHSNEPIYKTQDGISLYGSKDVLDYALDKHCKENNIQINSPEYIQAKLEISGNLSSVISHFDNPYPENEEYLQAISSFVATPTISLFDMNEDYNERPTCFVDKANEMIADTIVRINKNENIQTEQEQKEASSDYMTAMLMAKILGNTDGNGRDEPPEA